VVLAFCLLSAPHSSPILAAATEPTGTERLLSLGVLLPSPTASEEEEGSEHVAHGS
jgi:hypothetical protein